MPAGTSPIWASIETQGSLNGPATVHLLNPIGSGKRLWLRKLKVWISAGQIVKVRRTASPIDLFGAGATITNDTPVRMDQRDVTAVAAEFLGTTFPDNGDTFTIAQSQWVFNMENSSEGLNVLKSVDFSESVEAGSAVEITSNAFGAGVTLRVHAIWDEE